MELKELIDQVIEPEAVEHKIKYALKYNLKEEVWFYRNLERALSGYANSLNNDLFLPDIIKKSKNNYEVIKEFKNDLKNESGQVEYEDNFKPIVNPKIPFLQKINLKLKKNWELRYTGGEMNIWDASRQKCVYKTLTIYQLANKEDGTLFDFDLPDGDTMHFNMFWVPEKNQGRKIGTKNFCYLCNFLFSLGVDVLFSPCLTIDQPNRPLKGPEWRLEHCHRLPDGTSVNRLGAWYERLGGGFCQIPEMNPQNIFFFSPKLILERKKIWENELPSNPFSRIEKNGIYSDEYVSILKNISPHTES